MPDTLFMNTIQVPPRLLKRLDSIFETPLTVIAAPSGFGKTVAMREWARHRAASHVHIHWYTACGESLSGTWKRLCALLAKIDAPTADRLSALDAPTRERLSEMIELLPEINCDAPTVLVIDNFHLIQSNAPDELIAALALHHNENLHVVVLTQPFGEGRGRQLSPPGSCKLGARNLLFERQEVASFFGRHGCFLSEGELDRVMAHTCGWIPAIRLQLAYFQSTGDTDPAPGVERLLWAMIWSPLDPADQETLVTLSLLERIRPGQVAAALHTVAEPGRVLDLLEESAFVFFERESGSYVIQEPLRLFLRERFEEYPPEKKSRVWKQMGEACLRMENLFSAFRFFILAEEYSAALSLPLSQKDLVDARRDEIVEVVEKMMAECPAEMLLRHPNASLVSALEEYVGTRPDAGEEGWHTIRRSVHTRPDYQESTLAMFSRDYALCLSFAQIENLSVMNARCREAFRGLLSPMGNVDCESAWSSESLMEEEPGVKVQVCEQYLTDPAPPAGVPGAGAPMQVHTKTTLRFTDPSGTGSPCEKTLHIAGVRQPDALGCGALYLLLRIAVWRGEAPGYAGGLEDRSDLALPGKRIPSLIRNPLEPLFQTRTAPDAFAGEWPGQDRMRASQRASRRQGRPLQKTHNALTPRERQIAELAKLGRTNKEIGKELFITPETVKMAMKKIFKKLEINSRYQL